jgi:RNA polymerase sigma factor (sigma-70 family)
MIPERRWALQIMDIEEQYEKIYRFCFYKVKDRDAAEDITQTTFLKMLQSDYEECGKQMNYLYSIAGNLCADWYRGRAREYPAEETFIDNMSWAAGHYGSYRNVGGHGSAGDGGGAASHSESTGDGSCTASCYESTEDGSWNRTAAHYGSVDAETGNFEDQLIEKMQLRSALDKLSPEEQNIIFLRYINEEPLAVISKLTGMSRFALYRRIEGIKKKLRKLLERQE